MSGRRIAIVLAGGVGERFWPLSRESRPKQLLRISGSGLTMLEEAVRRVQPVVDDGQVFVSTTEALAIAIGDSGVVPRDRLLVEPARRNTLGALGWAAAELIARHGAEWPSIALAIVTADHFIGDVTAYQSALQVALDTALSSGGLVTIGIRPSRPETGYGYIEAGERHGAARRVAQFREKPSLADAERYASSGNHLWNSGMFFWTIRAFMDEISAVEPRIAQTIRDMSDQLRKNDRRSAATLFETLPATSVDYALMEKAKLVFVVEGEFQWDDLGSLDALARVMKPDEQGNMMRGNAVAVESERCLVFNESDRMTAAVLGVEGLLVVATDDAVFVCRRDQSQDVRKVVEQLRARGSKAT